MFKTRRKLLRLGLLGLSVTAFLFVNSGIAKAGFSDLPTSFFNDANTYLNIGISANNDTTGQGGQVDRSAIKLYMQSQPAGNVNIPVNLNDVIGGVGSGSDCTQVRHVYWQVVKLDSSEAAVVSQSTENELRTGFSGTQCGTHTMSIPSTWFTQSSLPQHAGLYTAVVRFRIDKYTSGQGNVSSYLEINNGWAGFPANPAVRFGFLAGNYATLYPSTDKTLSWVFRAPCNLSNAGGILYWGETDQDTTIAQPSSYGLKVELFKNGVSVGDLTQRSDKSHGDPMSYYGGVYGPGATSPITGNSYGDPAWDPGAAYELRISNVKGGNGIYATLPFDSGDYYIGCPKPFDTRGDTSVSVGSGSDEENPTSITATGTIQEQRPAGGTEAPVKTATLKLFRNGIEIASTTDNSFQWVGSPPKTLTLPYPFPAGSARAQGWKAGDRICSTLTWTYKSGLVIPGDPDSVSSGTPGSVSSATSGSGCITITNKPYVSVYGNDVSAGGGINRQIAGVAACDDQGKNNISANSKSAGSGTQLAAFAPGTIGGSPIGGFKSIFLKSGGSPTTPNGLTFGNESPGPWGGYKMVDCSTDFYTEDQYPDGDSRKNEVNNGALNINAANFMDDGEQTVVRPNSGLLRLMNPASQRVSTHHSVFVDGDVYITHNITYAFNNATDDGWTDIASIPYFNLVVKGNIYIDPSVTQLDGRYIAQPKDDGSGGQIYTCAPGGVPPTDLWVQCGGQAYQNNPSNLANVKLTVNGQFIATSIRFLRTAATISNGASGETAANSRAAEVFNFSPEMYLAQPAVRPKATSTGGPEQSISALPPIL